MNDQYTPPKSRVADSRPVGAPRPGSIKLALVMIALFVLVRCYHQLASWEQMQNAEISAIRWLADWLWVIALAVTGFLIARGRGWARWVLVAFTLYELYQMSDALMFLPMFRPDGFGEFVSTMSLIMLPLGAIVSVAAVVLVFGPGRGWFGNRT